jgi:hypothetical protein
MDKSDIAILIAVLGVIIELFFGIASLIAA